MQSASSNTIVLKSKVLLIITYCSILMSTSMPFYPVQIVLTEIIIVVGTILLGLLYFLSQKKKL